MPTARRGVQATHERNAIYPCEPPTVLPVAFALEWDVICREQCNVLVEAASVVIDQIVRALRPHLCDPIEEYSPALGVAVPQLTEGSLLLLEVGRMVPAQQARLLRWLNEDAGGSSIQLASTSSEPLFP